MSDVFRTFIAENQSLEFSYAEAKIRRKTHRKGARRDINPFTRKQYILLNLALGGDNGGEIDDLAFPMRYEIDYVRIYERSQE